MKRKIITSFLYGSLLAASAGGAVAGETLEMKLERLEKTLAEQTKVIGVQKQILEQQQHELALLRRQLLKTKYLGDLRGAGVPGFQPVAANASDGAEWLKEREKMGAVAGRPSQPRVRLAQEEKRRRPVGEAPPKAQKRKPKVLAIPELGGVLTPRGKLILEPSLQLSNSQVNRFTFLGVEVLETFYIGLLEAEDADRDLVSPALTVRYGMTDRLEFEAKIPDIYRKDRLAAVIPSIDANAATVRELDGSGIGDVEVALHYQLNRGGDGWPFFIANLRYKSTTGKGPFDVSRNADGVETELPTGSGFQAIEPGLTMLYPSDPAVFFTSVGYVLNRKDNIDKTFSVASGSQTIGEVDPGDAFRVSFGMAYAINQRASFTLGYKHDFIGKTTTEINGVKLSSSRLNVGALLLGFGFQASDRVGVNLNLELGVTADAPDVTATLRVPYSF